MLGFITNHGYLDNPTFRGMRWHLLHTFDKIYVLDLHGNSKKKEVCPDGSADKNVFDIMQGVAIIIGVKKRALHPCPSGEGTGVGAVKRTKYGKLDTMDTPTTTPPLKGRGLSSPRHWPKSVMAICGEIAVPRMRRFGQGTESRFLLHSFHTKHRIILRIARL